MATGETGFDDVTFDLISVQYHSLEAGHDYGQYVRDAENAGLADPKPQGDVASVPAPDPLLYATYDGSMGKPSGPALGTETGLTGKIKDALS
jgi:hypothetical protein